jgi:hypothetical protein
VLTGAGISAESGVPTFRDALTGLWERFDPEELATEERTGVNLRWCGSGISIGASWWRRPGRIQPTMRLRCWPG